MDVLSIHSYIYLYIKFVVVHHIRRNIKLRLVFIDTSGTSSASRNLDFYLSPLTASTRKTFITYAFIECNELEKL